jgi:hypothetical protein
VNGLRMGPWHTARRIAGGRGRAVARRVVPLLLVPTGASACGGDGGDGEMPRGATAEITMEPAATATPPARWEDRVWVRSDTSELPGQMRIFLSDGALLMDSCWEVYRLSRWRREAGDIVWTEDGREIRAEVLEASDERLRLRLQLTDGPREEAYRRAEVPFVCPEMAR